MKTDTPAAPRDSLYCRPVVAVSDEKSQRVSADPCPVCGCEESRRLYALPQTRFTINTCVDCGLGRLTPAPSSAEITSFYASEYYGAAGSKFRARTEWLIRLVAKRQTRFLSRHIPANGRVLDVGCGRGVVASPLARAGYDVTGLEISSDAVQGIDERVHVVIADSLRAAEFDNESFDVVVIWHVLEHLPDPAETLAEIHRVLRSEGRIVVAVPNFSSAQARWAGSAWFHLDPPRHLFHFPATSLARLLQDSGFEIEATHHFSLRQNPFGWLQSAINRWWPRRRNRLYDCLLNGPAARSMPFATRVAWVAVYWAGMPLALFPAIVAALWKSGGTIHYVAKKR